MTMGERIKEERNRLGWKQEELGARLTPKVNKAAVNKWESGQVENIKRTHILQMSKLFQITPAELMCFDDQFNSEQVSEETKVIEMIQNTFGKDAVQLLTHFSALNELGKTKAINDLSDLTEIQKYSVKSQDV
ncbi:MAG: helix-turn-helix transcriptional regulator [Lachnospiraceae bacterium]|nr:helix-turn-helix transcriptional regulator [Lachnospiraceae bacterium]